MEHHQSAYNFMISRAVDVVALKLAGTDRETVARFTDVLRKEAKKISDELYFSGQSVSAEILAARLDGAVKRLKYELYNKTGDPSPYDFPIFNVSHNATDVYQKPINHLYDKLYRDTYSTFVKQNLPIVSISQEQTQLKPSMVANEKPSTNSTQHYESIIDKYMPNLAKQKSQQLSNSSNNLLIRNNSRQSLSSTREHLRLQLYPKSLSIFPKDIDVAYTKPVLEPSNIQDKKKKTRVVTKKIYTSEDTVVGSETIEDLFEVIKTHQAKSSDTKSMTERIIIIDRTNTKSTTPSLTQKSMNKSSVESTATASKPIPTSSTVSLMTNNTFAFQQQPNFYMTPQATYQQPFFYTPMIPNNYYNQITYSTYRNSFYPFGYYAY